MLRSLKIVILSFSFVALFLCVWIFFRFNKDYELELAKDAFLKEHYIESQKILDELSSKGGISGFQSSLYTASLFLHQYHLKEADAILKTIDSKDPEYLFLKGFLGYLNQDVKSITDSLKGLEKEFSQNGYYQWLAGIQAYLNKDYSTAFYQFKVLGNFEPISAWMQKGLEEFVSPQEIFLKQAESGILAENYLEIREELLKKKQYVNQPYLHERISFLIALSYFCEGREKPASFALLYYKLAAEHLQNVSNTLPEWEKHRDLFLKGTIAHLKNIEQKQKNAAAAFCLEILLEWGSEKDIIDFFAAESTYLKNRLEEKNWDEVDRLIESYKIFTYYPKFRKNICDIISPYIERAFLENSLDSFRHLYELYNFFSMDKNSYCKAWKEHLQAQLYASIGQNKLTSHTWDLLQFRLAIEKKPLHKERLLSDLATGLSYQGDFFPKKSEWLFFLTSIGGSYTPNTEVNHLKDKFFFSCFVKSQKSNLKVSKFLYYNSLYELKQFETLISFLKAQEKLKSKEKELLLCAYVEQQEFESAYQVFQTLKYPETVSDATRLHLGYLFYFLKDEKNAYIQFQKIQKKTAEVYAHLCYLEAKLGQKKQALLFAKDLKFPYADLPFFRSLIQTQYRLDSTVSQSSTSILFPKRFVTCYETFWNFRLSESE